MDSTDSKIFEVNLNTYNGPLDVLLDLAKSQKVDLEKISVTKLADQFHAFITKAQNLNLEIASEYLLMATWLTYLKSKLLLPEDDDDDELPEDGSHSEAFSDESSQADASCKGASAATAASARLPFRRTGARSPSMSKRCRRFREYVLPARRHS